MDGLGNFPLFRFHSSHEGWLEGEESLSLSLSAGQVAFLGRSGERDQLLEDRAMNRVRYEGAWNGEFHLQVVCRFCDHCQVNLAALIHMNDHVTYY